MCIRFPERHERAFTLVEVLVAAALAGVVATVVGSLMYFTSRSFVAATNYTDMALRSRMSLDDMSRTLREARQVTAFATNSITVLDVDGQSVRFSFDPSNRSLVKTSGGQTKTYLTGCDLLQFWVYQRTPISNSFDCYTPAYVTNAKLVQVTWRCSREIGGAAVNTEVMESAKICLRNH